MNSIEKAASTQNNHVVRPRVDVFENDQEYLVVADLPGVTRDGIDIRFEGGELRIEGRRATAQTAAKEGPLPEPPKALAQEYRVADYRRAFTVGDEVDAEKIDAELKDGVLKVHLPKSAAKRARRIDVRTN